MSRRRTSVAAGQFRAPGREVTGWLQGTPRLQAEVPGPAVRSLRVFLSSILPRSAAVPGAFIGSGSTRSAAPVRQLALKNLNFREEIRFFLGRVNLRIACPDRRHQQPPNQPLDSCVLHVPSSFIFPPLLPRWTVVTRARSDENDPDADMLLATAAYYSRLRISQHAT